jgi:hypothetical protein
MRREVEEQLRNDKQPDLITEAIVGKKKFVSVMNVSLDTNVGQITFSDYLSHVVKKNGLESGYRYPSKDEFDELCINHPFFELAVDLDGKGHIFINDLGLKIFVTNYIDSWSYCIYGPLCICAESIEEEKKWIERGRPCIDEYIENCYDIRARKYKKYFDYRVMRHMILVKDIDCPIVCA